MKLLVATHNKGKVAELSEMLVEAGIECLSLDEAGVTFDVEETGSTFLDNATLKATQYARATGLLTLADDSGLEVVALQGDPGVYTARYGGKALTQVQRNQFLLTNMAHVDDTERTAQFRCVMVLCDGEGEVVASAEGICPGVITKEPRGTGGFGYDPIFCAEGEVRSMAELSSAEKHAISHRGKAVRAIIPAIQKNR